MDQQRRSPHSSVPESQMEMMLADGTILTDYKTAHHRAGDPSYQTLLPETCSKCRKQKAEAVEAARPEPTRPDEAWLNDQQT